MKALKFSHKGKRKSNQDLILEESFGDVFYLLAVIDGMGGYEYGDLASDIVAENITTYLSTISTPNEFHVQKAINKANLAIRQRKSDLHCEMGATMGGIIIHGSDAICFWVGDVKVYHFQNNHLVFESRSHTLINSLTDSNSQAIRLNNQKYKHIVTRSIQGDIKNSKSDIHLIRGINESDLFIICSDGVHNLIDGLQIENLINNSNTLKECFDGIISLVLNEAEDNFSIGFFKRDNI